MASPHVAGAAALVIAHGNATTPNEVRAALQETAENLGDDIGWDEEYGWGLVDAYAALQWITEPECTTSVTRQCGESNIGECEYGTQTCSVEGFWGKCIGAIYPTDEICDEKDNDCDGTVDEECQSNLCLNCFKGVCDDKCHPKEDETCPDCS